MGKPFGAYWASRCMWIVKYITDHYGTKIHRKEIQISSFILGLALSTITKSISYAWPPCYEVLFMSDQYNMNE